MRDHISILCTKQLDDIYIKQAAAQAIDIECVPFIKIIPAITDEVAEKIKALAQRETYVVFTSVNAVHIVADCIETVPGWKVFCTSGATHDAVRKNFEGIEVMATAETGAALAEKIKAHAEIKDTVFFGSDIRTPDLANGLKGNVALTEVFVYTTEQTPVKLDKDYDGILFFSPSAVKSFFSVNKVNTQTVLFAIGSTTANALAGHANKTIISAQPSQQGMMDTLTGYFKK